MSLGAKPKEYPTIITTLLTLAVLLFWMVCGVVGFKIIIGGVYEHAKKVIVQVDFDARAKAEQYPSRPLV